MSNEEKFQEIINSLVKAQTLADELGIGDIYNYSRPKEMIMASALNHKMAKTFAGPDGEEQDGKEAEYKSTISESIKATYNGISVQETWEEQEIYLKTKKIGRYPFHYFARFESGIKIAEMWRMSSDDVLKVLLPKLKTQFFSKGKRKDPRLGASINEKEIIEYGTKMEFIDGKFFVPKIVL